MHTAQTIYYQENLAFCVQLCTVAHFQGFLSLPWFSCSLVFFPYLEAELNQIWRNFVLCMEKKGDFVYFYLFIHRRCSISILVVVPIFKLLKWWGQGNIHLRAQFQTSRPPSLPLSHMRNCAFVIFLFGPYSECKQHQENQTLLGF